MSDEPNLHASRPPRRTEAEIIQAILDGQLDINEVKVAVKVQVDEIDKSGEEPRLARSRVYLDGEQTDVTVY